VSTSVSTDTSRHAEAEPGQTAASSAAPGERPEHDQPEDALALLQNFQTGQISPQMVADAEHRLERALEAAQRGHAPPAALLLRQVATDLGITLFLR